MKTFLTRSVLKFYYESVCINNIRKSEIQSYMPVDIPMIPSYMLEGGQKLSVCNSSLDMESKMVDQALDSVENLPDTVSEAVLMHKDQSTEIQRQHAILDTLRVIIVIYIQSPNCNHCPCNL